MANEYTERDDAECNSCGSEAPLAEFEGHYMGAGRGTSPTRLLCQFCACTLTGTYTEYPTRGDLFQALRQEVWMAAACTYNMLAARRKP